MKYFSKDEIEDYYDKTKIHYSRAWDLEASKAIHYGYYSKNTKNFRESLEEMNRALAAFGRISGDEYVLDAGCGVGGSSVFLAKTLGCKVKGITITAHQVSDAFKNAKEANVSNLTDFEKADYTETGLPGETFDVIWALESVVHTPDKSVFLKEAFRILKPGGRIIMGDYFKTGKKLTPSNRKTLDKWLNAWAIHDIADIIEIEEQAKEQGFKKVITKNVTTNISKSAWRMFYGSFFMTTLSGLYRIYNPKVSRFADNHHKGLYYQYPALRKNLWNYYFVEFQK